MPTVISNTEITSYNTCTQQHHYMYDRQLEPRSYSVPIQKGNIGHTVLETYYQARRNGYSHEPAVAEANLKLVGLVRTADPANFEYIEILADMTKLMNMYFDFCRQDTFKVLAVETIITAPLTDDILFGLVLDLLVELTTGPFRGAIQIWDHKFLTNFKSEDDLRLDGQQPKYLKTAQLSGLNVKDAIFNQIRTRRMKDPKPSDLFRRSPLISTKTAVDTLWEETQGAAVELNSQGRRKIRRTMYYSACKNCFFRQLCMAELAGDPVDTMLKVNYQKRDRPLKNWVFGDD